MALGLLNDISKFRLFSLQRIFVNGSMARSLLLRTTILTALLGSVCSASSAAERVRWQFHDREVEYFGQLLPVSSDQQQLLQTPDGVLWTINNDDLIRTAPADEAFEPLDTAELSVRLLEELPEGFEIYQTTHYLICYDTTKAYAQWCGSLFERLHMAFTNYWSRRGFDLHEPQFPLVAIVFADVNAYRDFARVEVGEAIDKIIGYYSLRTNRMTMYDLSGMSSARRPGDRRSTQKQINAILSRPNAEWTVATIIHEATHQIAFNTGLHTRYADIPLWVSEGIAVYFETPDLSGDRGWRTVDVVNPIRQRVFLKYLATRPPGSLQSLIQDDERFRNPRTASEAYAEAWALNYYLLRRHRDEYLEYLQLLAEKQPLETTDPQKRLADFRKCLGNDLDALDEDFVRYMRDVR